jgi:hypothetical protein
MNQNGETERLLKRLRAKWAKVLGAYPELGREFGREPWDAEGRMNPKAFNAYKEARSSRARTVLSGQQADAPSWAERLRNVIAGPGLPERRYTPPPPPASTISGREFLTSLASPIGGRDVRKKFWEERGITLPQMEKGLGKAFAQQVVDIGKMATEPSFERFRALREGMPSPEAQRGIEEFALREGKPPTRSEMTEIREGLTPLPKYVRGGLELVPLAAVPATGGLQRKVLAGTLGGLTAGPVRRLAAGALSGPAAMEYGAEVGLKKAAGLARRVLPGRRPPAEVVPAPARPVEAPTGPATRGAEAEQGKLDSLFLPGESGTLTVNDAFARAKEQGLVKTKQEFQNLLRKELNEQLIDSGTGTTGMKPTLKGLIPLELSPIATVRRMPQAATRPAGIPTPARAADIPTPARPVEVPTGPARAARIGDDVVFEGADGTTGAGKVIGKGTIEINEVSKPYFTIKTATEEVVQRPIEAVRLRAADIPTTTRPVEVPTGPAAARAGAPARTIDDVVTGITENVGGTKASVPLVQRNVRDRFNTLLADTGLNPRQMTTARKYISKYTDLDDAGIDDVLARARVGEVPAPIAPAPTPTTGGVAPAVQEALRKAGHFREIDAPGFFSRFLDAIPVIKKAYRYIRPGDVETPIRIQTAFVAQRSEEALFSAKTVLPRQRIFDEADRLFGPRATQDAKTNVRFIGTASEARTINGLLFDVAQRPHLYNLSAEQSAFLTNVWQPHNSKFMQELIKLYGANLNEFPAPPGGVFLSNVNIADELLEALGKSAQQMGLLGRGKTRVFQTAADRMASDPTFKPQTNIRTLQTGMDDWKSFVAGREVFSQGAGGLTRVQAVDLIHPGLRAAKDALARRVRNLRARIDTAVRQERQLAVRAGRAGTAARQAKRRTEPISGRLEELEGTLEAVEKLDAKSPEFGPEFSYLSGQARELLRAATQAEARGVNLALRAVGRGDAAKTMKKELYDLVPELWAVRKRYEAADLGKDLLFVEKPLYRYFPSADKKAVEELQRTSNNTLVRIADEWRGTAFAGDLSPIAGIQMPIGFLFNAKLGIQRLVGAGRATVQSRDLMHVFRTRTLADDVASDVVGWQEFAFWSGIPVRGGTPQEFSGGLLRHIPGFTRANEAMYRLVMRQTSPRWCTRFGTLPGSGSRPHERLRFGLFRPPCRFLRGRRPLLLRHPRALSRWGWGSHSHPPKAWLCGLPS